MSCVRTTDGLAIASISNLQSVNGAQTTGAIHAALKTAKDQLSGVFVQMKLTVVPAERSEDIVPKISEYANTQNKVNAADFFSNHPFHIRIDMSVWAKRRRSGGGVLEETARLGARKKPPFTEGLADP